MKNIYNSERVFRLTQGVIITNCVCSYGYDIDTWGFVITSRCDCAQKKVEEIYYVPIVNACDWFHKYEKERYFNRWMDGKKKSLARQLNEINKSKIPDYNIFSRNEIEKMLIQQKEKTKAEILSLYDELHGNNDENFLNYLKAQNKFSLINDDIDRLVKNEENNFILIPDWQPSRKGKHKIILLREIKRLQNKVAFAFEDPFETIFGEHDIIEGENDIKTEPTDIYCIDTEVISPYVEYIMQRFARNFIRIGIEENPSNTNENLINEIKETL